MKDGWISPEDMESTGVSLGVLLDEYDHGRFQELIADLGLDLTELIEEAHRRFQKYQRAFNPHGDRADFMTMWIEGYLEGAYYERKRATSGQDAGNAAS